MRDFGFTQSEYDEWNADYADRLSRAPLFGGVREMIETLSSKVRMALVTSRKHEIAHIGLEGAGLLFQKFEALKKELEEMDAGLDIKQSAKMRAFRDNMQAMYGVDPYKV